MYVMADLNSPSKAGFVGISWALNSLSACNLKLNDILALRYGTLKDGYCRRAMCNRVMG